MLTRPHPSPAMVRRVALASAAWAVAVISCGSASSTADPQRFTVAAAAYPLAEAAGRIAGTSADVVSLTPPGQEPHEYELTAKDVRAATSADLIVFLKDFQPAIDNLIAGGIDGTALNVMPATTRDDPHVWVAPLHMIDIVDAVEAAMNSQAPASIASFTANATAYRRELTQLDLDFTNALRECARDTVITEHAAFGHLAAAYGFNELPLRSVEDAEPSAKDLEAAISTARRAGTTTVFTFHAEHSALVTSVASELDAEIARLDPIETITSEALSQGATYLTLQRANLAALSAALGCS